MEEIFKEFGFIYAPSMYEITKMIYENKYKEDYYNKTFKK